jgi:predicted DCC family thiol-disulfide oxidoreductase YuxK
VPSSSTARLYYDSDCGFCRWLLAWVLRADRDQVLQPLPIESPEGDRDLGELGEGRTESWHLVRGGSRFSGGRALAPLLEELRPLRRLAPLARRLEFLSVPGYRWVAAHRVGLSRLVPRSSKRRADTFLRSRAS